MTFLWAEIIKVTDLNGWLYKSLAQGNRKRGMERYSSMLSLFLFLSLCGSGLHNLSKCSIEKIKRIGSPINEMSFIIYSPLLVVIVKVHKYMFRYIKQKVCLYIVFKCSTMFGVSKFFLFYIFKHELIWILSLNTLIQQGCIQLIKSDNKDTLNIIKYFCFKCCSFELCNC